MRRPFLLLCIGILLSVTLAGCGGGDSNIKNAPYEGVPLEDIDGNDLTGASAQHLYQAGHQLLAAGQTDEAIHVYSVIQSRFPFTPLAKQAGLETVTAHFIHKDYAKAVAAADRFIKQHPRHPHVDYVYYLRGLSNYHRNDPGFLGGNPDQRDLSYLKQAFSDFKQLIRMFPNSVYAKDAQLHMIKIQNRLADFELSVAEYYLQRHAYVAAARRASYIVRHYQRSSSTPRALEIMQEAYSQLNLPELAQDARSIIQASYPGYILHRGKFYAQRSNKFYGDDALPGHDSDDLVKMPPSKAEKLLMDLAPWSDSNAHRRPAWMMYSGSRVPLRRSDEDKKEQSAADDDNVDAEESAAQASDAGTQDKAEDDPGFFGDVWNVLTPGD